MRTRGWVVAGHLFGGTVLVQVAVLVATIYSAALLTPRDFGLFGAVFGISGIVNGFNALGVESRIAVADQAAVDSLLRVGAVALVVFASAGSGLSVLPAAFGQQTFAAVILLGTFASVVFSVQMIATSLALRDSHHGVLVRSRVAQGITNALLIVTLVRLPLPGYLALAAAWIISMIVGALVALASLGWPGPSHWRPSTRDATRARAEVGVMPFTSLLAGMTMQIPLVVFPIFAGPALAGSWALSARILGAGVTTSYNSIQPVYYATAAMHIRAQDHSALVSWHRRWALGLVLAAIPGFALAGLLLYFGLPLLGAEWEPARLLVVPACLYWGSVFAVLPLSQTLPAVARSELQFKWEVARLATAVFAFALWPVWGALNSVWAWSLACVGASLALIVLQVRVLRGMAR